MNDNGMNAEVSVPLQRQTGRFVRLLKRLLLTQTGKRFAFAFGLRGFNRVMEQHLKFVGKHPTGQQLEQNEIALTTADNEAIPAGECWVYRLMTPQYVYNSRVDKGAALQASLMSGSSLGSISSPLPPLYIALSTASLSPAHADTTLASETSVAGLGRALGTAQNYVAPSALDAAASYDIYKQFTLTGTATTVVSTGLFDAVSSGNLFAEVNFSTSAAMSTNDILQVTWTINI